MMKVEIDQTLEANLFHSAQFLQRNSEGQVKNKARSGRSKRQAGNAANLSELINASTQNNL